MHPSGLLLLLVLVGLLAFSAALAPGSGQIPLPAPSHECLLPPEEGPCRDYTLHYYYNPTEQRCQKFFYGSCGGNSNNFKTRKECEEACPARSHQCLLPPDQGKCFAYVETYYYIAAQRRCLTFLYGGCGGNSNNFETEEECEEACIGICSLPKDSGPCDAKMERYYYDSTCGICRPFVYGGCEGNGNRFVNQEECMMVCGNQCKGQDFCLEKETAQEQTSLSHEAPNHQCLLPLDYGFCISHIPRYYYNATEQRCLLFIYGGCGGNSNKFITIVECQEACIEICYLPKDSGPCGAKVEHYYYNRVSRKCEPFVYGGCGGNGNRFLNQQECMMVCGNQCTGQDFSLEKAHRPAQ